MSETTDKLEAVVDLDYTRILLYKGTTLVDKALFVGNKDLDSLKFENAAAPKLWEATDVVGSYTHGSLPECLKPGWRLEVGGVKYPIMVQGQAPKGGDGDTVSREYFDQQMQLLASQFQQQQNLNVWKETIDSGSTRHRGQFADKARKFYDREFHKTAYCMLTNLPGAVVGHLWPHSKIDDSRVNSLNILRENLEGPRNAIVVLQSIEEAFDRGRLCLVWHAFNKQFVVVILDPALKDEFVAEELKFAAIEGNYLRHPAGKIPFLRVLGVHASESYSEALVNGWITQTEFDIFKDFRALSPIEKQAVVVHQSLSERYPVFGNEYTIDSGDEVMVLASQKEYKAKVVKCISATSYLIEYGPNDRTEASAKFISKLPLLHNRK